MSTPYNIKQILDLCPVMPVIVINNLDHAVPLARALVKGGLRVLEITLRTPQALPAIKLIKQEVPEAVVGAGTILTPQDLEATVAAGSAFGISPGATPGLLKAAAEAGHVFMPAVATASEIMQGLEFGFTSFKFFPAESSGGVAALKSFQGPFGHVNFCATGGITEATLPNYLALSNVDCVGGSWMVTSKDIEAERWDHISTLAAQALAKAKAV